MASRMPEISELKPQLPLVRPRRNDHLEDLLLVVVFESVVVRQQIVQGVVKVVDLVIQPGSERDRDDRRLAHRELPVGQTLTPQPPHRRSRVDAQRTDHPGRSQAPEDLHHAGVDRVGRRPGITGTQRPQQAAGPGRLRDDPGAGQERPPALMAAHPARFLQLVQRPADGDHADARAGRQFGVGRQHVAWSQPCSATRSSTYATTCLYSSRESGRSGGACHGRLPPRSTTMAFHPNLRPGSRRMRPGWRSGSR
jgi:hypothetical protein